MTKKFTVQVAYVLESFGHVVVEAESPEGAAAQVLEGEINTDNFKDDYESSSAFYVAGTVEGEFDSLYTPQSRNLETHEPPYALGQEHAVRQWLNLPQGPSVLRDLVAELTGLLEDALTTHIYDEGNGDEIPEDCRYSSAIARANGVLEVIGKPAAEPLDEVLGELLAYKAAQFDGDPEDDLSVSGADLVDEFSAWRPRIRSALYGINTPSVCHVAPRVVVEVDGGVVTDVTSSVRLPGIKVFVIDTDTADTERDCLDMVRRGTDQLPSWEQARVASYDLGTSPPQPFPAIRDASEPEFDEEFAE